jgi:hypothetical protein
MNPCQTCGQRPCLCVKTILPAPSWLTQDCATPGCFTIIRFRLGTAATPPICRWCQAGTSHAMQGHPAVDPRRDPASP